MTSPQPPIDYTSRDFAGFVSMMKSAAVTRFPEWTSTDPSDFGNVLIEAWSYLGDVLSFYSDRVANESYLATATQPASLLAIAALLDYQPQSTAPATTLLSVTIPATASTTIPAGTQVTTVGVTVGVPVSFEVDNDTLILAVPGAVDGALQTITCSATQGQTIQNESVGTSTGLMNQDFSLLQQPVIGGSVIVSVVETPDGNAQQWVYTAHLVDADPTDNYYSMSTDANGATHVAFGDGVLGRIPPLGSVITAQYRIGGGPVGNVGTNTLTTFIDITEIVANSNGALSGNDIQVTNLAPATGGAAAESIASIRANAPASLTTLNRAITLDDFAALAVQVPTVAKAKAVSAVYTNVVVYVAPAGGGTPNQSLLNLVVASLAPKKLPNVNITASTPVYQPIDVTAVVAAGDPYTRATVLQNVTAALGRLFAFDNVEFGQRVTVSSVYQTIQSSIGVVYATVGVVAPSGGTTISDILLPANVIPTLGNLNLVITGGVDVSTPIGIIGSSTSGPTPPGAPGAPEITLQRCDPNSSHFEMNWSPGTNADHYQVVFNYLSAEGVYPNNVVSSAIFGPFTTDIAVIDAPLIGNASLPASQQAQSLYITVQAFNGTAGPVSGTSLATAYLCEQPSQSATPPSAPSAPQVSNVSVQSYDSNGNPVYQLNVSWTPAGNTSSTSLVYEVLDAGGNVLNSGSTVSGSVTSINDFTVTVVKDTGAAIRLYVAAYNGGVGPVNGSSVTIPVTTVAAGTSYVGQPQLTSDAWASYTRNGDGSVVGEVSVTGHNMASTSVVVEYLNSGGVASTHSYTSQGGGTGPSSTDSSFTVNISAAAPDTGFTASQVRVTVYANNPNGTSAGQQTVHAY